MTLQERIRDCRRRAGLSQEQLAERLGVSRQAVAKWEAGRSAPSTEHLLKLAGVLQVELTQLVPPEDFGENDPDGAASQAEAGRPEWRERLRWAALTAGAYLALFLLGRLLWGRREGYSLLGWLTSWQSDLYVFGWLLSSRLFWLAMGISVLAALAGRVRLAGTSLAAMPLGIFLGELLGPFPEGAPLGHGHYGWLIWGGISLIGLASGGVLEGMHRRGIPLRSRAGRLWLLGTAGAAAACLLACRLLV